MSFWNPEELREVTGGRWLARPTEGPGHVEPHGVSIDSRTVAPGQVFIALRGENFDGHDFLPQAFSAGAALAIVDRQDCLEVLKITHDSVLLVPDSQVALSRLATAYRRRLNATVIAITGSVGKTTAKSLIDAVLRTAMPGAVAPKSFNNHIGVPLTLLSAEISDKYVIVEVGTNAPGEIAALAKIVEPDVAIITHIGLAHTKQLGGLVDIAQEKTALLRNMHADGLAIVNGDSSPLVEHIKLLPRVVQFGRGEHCDLRLTDYSPQAGGGTMQVNGRVKFKLAMVGEHNALNALVAVAVGRHMNLSDETIAEGLAKASGPPMRLQIQTLGHAPGLTLINDAYNANPDSMAAALRVLASTPAQRRVAILGDMAELGDIGPQAHRDIGRLLGELKIDRAIVIGSLARYIGQAFAQGGGAVEAHEDADPVAIERIVGGIHLGDGVLIKASRCMALERVARVIADQFQTQPPVV